ncbi:unnamed protein product [Clonostachys rosea]|uniref:Transcription factor domain-containing protein n=1 Tax=Bionectria ochroleuca TaxID=29856 RepID=A0ABY6UFJ1_BIOOC|nr:unnamed protein product [Clonostachys rosea]
MIGVLTILQQQDLLGGALPFDLERVFSAGFVSTMLSVIHPDERTYRALYSQACYLLEEFIHRGLTPASFRKSEIELLVDMIRLWKSRECGNTPGVQYGEQEQEQQVVQPLYGDESNAVPNSEHAFGVMCDLSPDQILSLAQMVEVQDGQLKDDMGWMDTWLWNHEDHLVPEL